MRKFQTETLALRENNALELANQSEHYNHKANSNEL